MIATKPRDIRGGDFSYGERIALARVLRNESLTDYQRVRETIQVLHDIEVTPEEAAGLTEYVTEIIEGFCEWIEREANELNIPPTADEIQAGVDRFAEACGDMGNVVGLAEQFHCTFEEVYKRPYLEVFTIQKIHTERTKYERRLTEVYSRKK